jgi:uncharacterized membrane protein
MTPLGPSQSDDRLSRVGVYLYALATVAAGVLDLIWGEFEAAHQPIGALGDHIPGQVIFAYITALCMIAGGAAILWRPTARTGALVTSVIYFAFGLFWLPRFYTAPHALGFGLPIMIGVSAGMFTQLIVVAGSLVLYSSLPPGESSQRQKFSAIARWVIGVGAVLFGLTHLTSIQLVAQMIPPWVPLGGPFWVVVSGIAFLLAGLAILTGILNVLAARLLGLMLLVFEVLVLVPNLIVSPHNHISWGSNAYNLAAAGAVWIFAASIARHAEPSKALSAGAAIPE